MLPLLLALTGCAWKLGPPAVTYANTTAELPLVRPSTDAQRWYVAVDAGDQGEWLLFVDTGYSYTTCDDDFVAALSAPERRGRASRGELGRIESTKAQLPALFLGEHQLDGLVCMVRDLATTSSIRDPGEIRVAGVLGIDALRPFRVELDPAAGRIRLREPDGLDALPPEGRVPLSRENRLGMRARVPLVVMGQTTRPVVDTGAANTYVAGRGLGLEPTWVDSNVTIRGTGPGGEAVRDRAYYEVDDLSVGGHQAGPLTLVDREPRAGAPGLLGLDVLDRFLVELDFRRGAARFTPTGPPQPRPGWVDWDRKLEPSVRVDTE